MAQETLFGFPAHTFPFRCGNLYWRRFACFPFLGYLRAKSRLVAVALRNAPAGAVPRTPFTRKGYAASVKRHRLPYLPSRRIYHFIDRLLASEQNWGKSSYCIQRGFVLNYYNYNRLK